MIVADTSPLNYLIFIDAVEILPRRVWSAKEMKSEVDRHIREF